MRRRGFLAGLGGAAAWPLALRSPRAQRPPVPVIGWIAPGTPVSDYLRAFKQGLLELGYREGETIVLAVRPALRGPSQVPELVRELLALNPALIVAIGPTVQPARLAAGSLPIVFGISADPVEAGLVASLSRPGGNLTGATFLSYELNAKRLELLRETFPRMSRVAILSNPMHAGERIELRELERAAESVGLRLRYVRIVSGSDLDAAFDDIRRAQSEAVLALPDALIMQQRLRIIGFAGELRIPAMSGWAPFARSGGLLTYGPNLDAMIRRLAIHVDRILKGAKPSELPVEQPTRFELIVNLLAAARLGIVIPPSVLVRADEVIE
jgi:putative ABC transport system substrate-binding protein